MKKNGIFGGTFDPIHHGHLILARDALEALHLDGVTFVPAAASPHKLEHDLAPPEIRLEMVRVAIEGEPRFSCDPIEVQRPPPSYAIDTIEVLRRREPDIQWFYLVGEDNVGLLATWHRFKELSEMVHFVVLARNGETADHSYRTIRRHLDISASNIRKRVATGQSIRYLVPSVVEKIIHDRQLYREPQK